jgi:glycosyltransferase involved in cell wall biosynthesis
MDARDGEHLLVADTAEGFAERVVELLRNPKQRRAIGASARSLIEREYSWTKIVSDLELKLTEVVREHHGSKLAEAPK